MMKKTILTLLALTMMVGAKAQDKPLLIIDGEPIMQSEFMYIYEKNNQETTIDQKSVDEYLDLFINFRLKVHEAEKLGLDTTQAFLKELNGYRAQATPKYMTYEEGEEKMARMSYEHMRKERRAAHIVIKCPMDAHPDTVAAALARIEDARVRVTTGKTTQVKKGKKMVNVTSPVEDFFAVAKEVSEDPNIEQTGGELGWIPTFRYVWPLEKAVYETPVGGVTEVFRSGFGFHIALVEEEREHEEVSASHIMKMVPRGNDAAAVIAKHQIDSLYQLVKSGANFAEIATANSDDKGSAVRGGELGWFSRGQMVKPFEDAAFALQNAGDISEPIFSNYGWHIILLQGKRGIQPYSEMEKDIRRRVAMDERHQEVNKAFVEKIRKEYNLSADMSDADVMAVENANLENKYPDLKNLMKEYHDGILLFDVSLKNVWDKASQDTLGLTEYFAANKADFKWDAPRFKGFIVYCKDKASAKIAKTIIRSANPDSVGSYLDKRVNTDSIRYVRVEHGVYAQGAKPAVDKLQWKTGDFEPSEEYPIVFLMGKKLKNPEVYTDERGKVVNAYQDALEQQWIEELRNKYTVEVNDEALAELKAKYEK